MSTTEREQTCQPVRGFTDRALDAHLRTVEERDAMEWLEPYTRDPVIPRYVRDHARKLQAMATRPAMPEEPPGDVINAMRAEHALAWDTAVHLYRTIRKALIAPPAPKTKTVWRVSWAVENESGVSPDYASAIDAADKARILLGCNPLRIVSITPHQVPV